MLDALLIGFVPEKVFNHSVKDMTCLGSTLYSLDTESCENASVIFKTRRWDAKRFQNITL